MNARIRAVQYHLPENIVTNEILQQENPHWDMKQVEQRAGVLSRHIAKENQTAQDLALEACKKLFLAEPQLKDKVDGILYCTQSPDYIMPANSFLLHKELDLREDVFCLDFNLACSGYVYGLSLVQGLIVSKQLKNVLLVNADTYSRYIHRQDRSVRVLFGDGAAVTWLSAEDSGEGLIDIVCATSGAFYDKFMIPAGGCRMPSSTETEKPIRDMSGNVRTQKHIRMDGLAILGFVNSRIPEQIQSLLAKHRLSVKDIDCFLFHQASKMALDSLVSILGVREEQFFTNLSHVGNTVSASIPIALKDAWDAGRVKPGQKVILCGFGVGLSWATALMVL